MVDVLIYSTFAKGKAAVGVDKNVLQEVMGRKEVKC